MNYYYYYVQQKKFVHWGELKHLSLALPSTKTFDVLAVKIVILVHLVVCNLGQSHNALSIR